MHGHVSEHVYTSTMNHEGVGDEIVAHVPNPAVSSSLLQEIQQWKMNGVTEKDIFSRCRCHTVPPGHTMYIPYLETWYVHWSEVNACTLYIHVHVRCN